MFQEKARKRLPEEEGGDVQATYAYFAAEAGAKAQGKEPLGQVSLQPVQRALLTPCRPLCLLHFTPSVC